MPSFPSNAALLPRKLRRPQFVFFRFLSLALFPSLALLAMAKNEAVFWLLALFGGSLWAVMAFILLVNWQVVTVAEDAVQITNYGRSQRVFHRDLRAIKAQFGARGIDGPTALPLLFLHGQGAEKTLTINLSLLSAAERVILLETLSTRAPQAKWDSTARQIREDAGRV